MTPRLYLGLPGLATDTLTLSVAHCMRASFEPANRRETLRHRVNMYQMKEDREISPRAFAALVSSTLYERRSVFFACLGNADKDQVLAVLHGTHHCRVGRQGRAFHCLHGSHISLHSPFVC
jgi:hypothetical protein